MAVKKKTTVKKDTVKLYCRRCEKTQSDANYYEATSVLDKNGKMSICKKCIGEIYDEYFDSYEDMTTAIYKTCQSVDIRFSEQAIEGLKSHILKAVESGRNVNNIYGVYKSKVSSTCKTNGSENMDFSHSDKLSSDEDTAEEQVEKREISPELKRRWGSDFTEDEYEALEDFYNGLCSSNRVETTQDKDYVKKISIVSHEYDRALMSGDAGNAKKFHEMYTKLMADAKFRATDMSGEDKNGGMRTIAQISEEVESDDFVPPWEKYAHKLKVKQDVVDKTIQYMLNFVLKFKDRQTMSEPPKGTPKVGK